MTASPRRLIGVLLLATAALLAPASAGAAGPTYRAHPVHHGGAPFAPSSQVRGNPFSASGRLLAGSSTTGGVTQAAIYDTTTRTVRLLGASVGGSSSTAVDVNDHGDVVGEAVIQGRSLTYFLPHRGRHPRTVGTNLTAYAINNHDVVVGESGFRAFRWQRHGRVFELLPGGSANLPVRANGINSAGLIVGETDLDGFVYDPRTKTTTELPTTPGQLYTAAYDINDRGVVAGQLQAGPDDTRPLTYAVTTKRLKLLPSGGQAAYGLRISRRGTVAGVLPNTAQAAVWNDCGVAFAPLGVAAAPGSPTPEVFGTAADGSTWTTDGGRLVRWTRRPACR